MHTHMQELPDDTTKDDAKTIMRQTVWLLQRVLKDKVYSVSVEKGYCKKLMNQIGAALECSSALLLEVGVASFRRILYMGVQM